MLTHTLVIFFCLQNANHRALEWNDSADRISILKGDDLVRHSSPIRNITEKSLPMDNAIESDTVENTHRELHHRKISSVESISSKVKRAEALMAANDEIFLQNGTEREIVENEVKNLNENLLKKKIAADVDGIHEDTTSKRKFKHKSLTKKTNSFEDNTISNLVLYFLLALFIIGIISGISYKAYHAQSQTSTPTRHKSRTEIDKIEYSQVSTEEPHISRSILRKSSFISKRSSKSCNKSAIKELDESPTRITNERIPIPTPTNSTSSTKSNHSNSSTARVGSCDNVDLNVEEVVGCSIEPSNDEEQDQDLGKSSKLCSKCNGCISAKTIMKKINEVEERGRRIHIPINIPLALGGKTLKSIRPVSLSTDDQQKPRTRATTPPTSTDIDSRAGDNEEYVPSSVHSAQLKRDHDRYSYCSATTVQSFPDEESKYDYVDSAGSAARTNQNDGSTMTAQFSDRDQPPRESNYQVCSSVDSSLAKSEKSGDRDEEGNSFRTTQSKPNKSYDTYGQSESSRASSTKTKHVNFCKTSVSAAKSTKSCDSDPVNSSRVSTAKSNESRFCTSNGDDNECNTRPSTISMAESVQNGKCTPSNVSTRKSNQDDDNHDHATICTEYTSTEKSSQNEDTSSNCSDAKSDHDKICTNGYASSVKSNEDSLTEFSSVQSDEQGIDSNTIQSQNEDYCQPEVRSLHASMASDSESNSHCGIPFNSPVKIKVLSTDPNYEPNTLDVKTQLNKLLADKSNQRSGMNQHIKGQVIYADVCFVKKESAYANKLSNGIAKNSSPSSVVMKYGNTPSECQNNCQYGVAGSCQSDDFNFSTYKELASQGSPDKNYEPREQYRECTASVCSDSMVRSNLFKKFGNGGKDPTRMLKQCSSVDSKAGLIQNLNQRLKGVYLSQNSGLETNDQSRQSTASKCSPVSEYPDDLESNTYEVARSQYGYGNEDTVRSSRNGMHKFLPRIRQYMSKRRRSNSACSEDPYYEAISKTKICSDCLKYLPPDVSETIKSKKSTLANARHFNKGRSTLHLDEIIKLYPDIHSQLSPSVQEALSRSTDDLSIGYNTPLCENDLRGRDMGWSELSTSFENLKCLN